MENTEKNKKALSSRQLICLTFMIGLGLNMLNLPALSVQGGGRDGWLIMLIMTAADTLMLYFTLFIMDKLQGMTAGEKACKILRRVIGAIGAVWTLAKLILIVGETRLFYGETVFENLDWMIFLIFIGIMIAVLGAGGARAIGRLSELALPLVAVTSAVLVFTSFEGDIDITDVFPVLYKNVDSLYLPLKLALWTGNYPVLFCFFGNVEIKKHTKLFAVGAAAISGIITTVLTFALGAVYGSLTHLISYGSNASSMNQYVGSYNFGRIDLIVFTLWSVALLIEAGIFTLCFVRSLTELTGKKNSWLFSLIASAAVYAVLNFGLTCKFKLFIFASDFASIPAFIIEFALPLAAFIATAVMLGVKNRGKGDRNDTHEKTADI